MRYPTVLFDLDHTLFDSETSLRRAFFETLSAVGVADPDALRPAFSALNDALWKQVEVGSMTPQEVHLGRFEQLGELLDVSTDPVSLAERYGEELGRHGDLYPGARELLDRLDGKVTLALITNGLSEVQRARLERLDLDRYFTAIVISAEAGTSKPGREIFDLTFATLGEPDRAGALMVGDSLSSDIAGGIGADIHTCWFNAAGLSPTGANVATHTVSALSQIEALVLG